MMNGAIIAALGISFAVITFLEISMFQMFLFLGVLLFVQSLAGFIRRDSASSIIPILEQIAKYEKEKMGSEWRKHRAVGSISSLLVSGIICLMAYLHLNSNELLTIEPMFLFLLTIVILVMTNISMVIHSRKVDGAQSPADCTGYTQNSNVRAVIFGVCSAILIFVLILSLV
ncbi:hypothetical protein [Cytobacillus firmus]|uniref:hypothetical protein n=1 Tax=Cytobacillus firmus TaxID=1399 RepID=UPI0022283019|nr:hypothetical protein [Cytobacillus firmus]